MSQRAGKASNRDIFNYVVPSAIVFWIDFRAALKLVELNWTCQTGYSLKVVASHCSSFSFGILFAGNI